MTEQPAPDHRTLGRARPVRVVVVEDHALVRQQIVGQLQEAGIEVLDAVATAQAGHQSVLTCHPDVVVLDNHLPDGIGIDLCRQLTQELPEVAVVIYSGHLSWEDQDQARHAGAAAAVAKTFSGRELLDAILVNTPSS